MAIKHKAMERLDQLRQGYPLEDAQGTRKMVYREKPSPNVLTDATLTNMNFARAMIGTPGVGAGGLGAVDGRAGKLEIPQSTATVRREAEQSQGVVRNPGGFTGLGEKSYRKSVNKRKE